MSMLAAPPFAPERTTLSRTITVPMGAMDSARRHELLRTIGLGSCVAMVIFAPAQQLAALAHCMLPSRDGPHQPASKYADTAVHALIERLQERGATAPYSAALVGGASMFPGMSTTFMQDLSGNTLRAARESLEAAGIPIRVEDVGGHVGRSMLADPVTQGVMVRTIRDGERWL